MELTQAVAAAESQCGELVVTPAAPPAIDWNTRLSWMAVGGLASVLVGAAVDRASLDPTAGSR